MAQNPNQNKKIRTSFLNLKQKIIRLAQGHWSCTPTHWNSFFMATSMKKNIWQLILAKGVFVNLLTETLWVQSSSITCLPEIQLRFLFVFLAKDKNEQTTKIYDLNYLLHEGLMLNISKVFTILCLLCLCENREYPGSFQNESVSSSFKRVPKYILFLNKLKGEGRPFQLWSGQA